MLVSNGDVTSFWRKKDVLIVFHVLIHSTFNGNVKLNLSKWTRITHTDTLCFYKHHIIRFSAHEEIKASYFCYFCSFSHTFERQKKLALNFFLCGELAFFVRFIRSYSECHMCKMNFLFKILFYCQWVQFFFLKKVILAVLLFLNCYFIQQLVFKKTTLTTPKYNICKKYNIEKIYQTPCTNKQTTTVTKSNQSSVTLKTKPKKPKIMLCIIIN